MFFLAEYINMATVSAVATTLFLGGYHAPWPLSMIPGIDSGYWGVIWFVVKVQLLISVFVWLRGTLPRFRYDQFMALGWKWMIPASLGWVMLISLFRGMQNHGLLQPATLGIVGLGLGALLLGGIAVSYLVESRRRPEVDFEADERPFDAFAGGYPVPPLPGQVLPELADVVVGERADTAPDNREGDDL